MQIELVYSGGLADRGQLDFYDVSQALLGFQRTLALTTHLVLNGEIITQAPALKGATIRVDTFEKGSWKVKATLIGLAAIGGATVASKDSLAGHLIWSAYDHVISQSLGFHVDYDSTLGAQYEQMRATKTNELPILTPGRFEALSEKCERAIIEMHRPIVFSETASSANIINCDLPGRPSIVGAIDRNSFRHLSDLIVRPTRDKIEGKVSSYNTNTFKGRIFVEAEDRPVPFELVELSRTEANVSLITQSLAVSAKRSSKGTRAGVIKMSVNRIEAKNGNLKSYDVLDVSR